MSDHSIWYSLITIGGTQRDLEKAWYRKTFNTGRTLVGNKIVDDSDVVEASPVGAAPTTSSFST